MCYALTHIIASIVFCWIIHCIQAIEQDCEYKFTVQPPNELECNPYGDINQLTLACSAEGPATPSFSIFWFRRKNNSTVDEELIGSSRQGVDIRAASGISIDGNVSFSSRLTLKGLNETNHTGDYWCQVRLKNGTFFQSNMLSLNNEERYLGFDPCRGTQSIERKDCLRTLEIALPAVTTGDIQTSAESVVQTSTSTELSPITYATGDPIGTTQFAIYVAVPIACAVAIFITIILLFMAIATCKLKAKNQDDNNSWPVTENQSQRPETNQNEAFVLKENVAYDKVGPIVVLNKNISYAPKTSKSSGPAPFPEYEEIDDSMYY